MNSRKQGDLGTSFAIAYFSGQGYTISIPISDSQPYDLIIEKDGICERIQVKTCFKRTKYNKFWVELRTISNTRGKKINIRKISDKDCDKIFIMDGEGKFYIIHSQDFVGKNGISLSKAEKYLVNLKLKFEIGDNSNS